MCDTSEPTRCHPNAIRGNPLGWGWTWVSPVSERTLVVKLAHLQYQRQLDKCALRVRLHTMNRRNSRIAGIREMAHSSTLPHATPHPAKCVLLVHGLFDVVLDFQEERGKLE